MTTLSFPQGQKMKKNRIWIPAAWVGLVVLSVLLSAVGLHPRFKVDLEKHFSKNLAFIRDNLKPKPLAIKPPPVAEEESQEHGPVNQSILPASHETWTYDFERFVRFKVPRSKTMHFQLKGEYSISRLETKPVSYLLKVTPSNPYPNLNESLPLFRIRMNQEGQIDQVFVMGRVKSKSLQEHWENVGKDIISSHFILDTRTRLGRIEGESKWMGLSLLEKTVVHYKDHPELKIDGSNSLAYFDEQGLALVEGSEQITIDGSKFSQSVSYRVERVAVMDGALQWPKSTPEKSLHWGIEKRLFTTGQYGKEKNVMSLVKRSPASKTTRIGKATLVCQAAHECDDSH